jgi:hypothetical protein
VKQGESLMNASSVSRNPANAPNGGLPVPTDQQTPSAKPATMTRPSAAVALSDRARAADAQRSILEKALSGMEDQFSKDDPFAQAGRADYLESVSNPSDLSAEATAGRILGGITGYIFGAFQLQHDKIGHDELEDFRDQVMRGFKRGMGEARQVLGAIDKLDDSLASEIGETERLVLDGLDKFFADQAAAIDARLGTATDTAA